MILFKRSILYFLIYLCSISTFSQESKRISGKVKDELGRPVIAVNVSVKDYPTNGTITNISGKFELDIHDIEKITLVFSFIGYERKTYELNLKESTPEEISISLKRSVKQIDEVEIIDDRERKTNLTRINPRIASIIPDASGSIEAIIKTMSGVTSHNELSSQYSVRGGNFDENLVYVNDIEIYRPFLIRSGQQEGLSFVNSDMVASILFSSGGFQNKFGDKMSSVLDIKF